MEKVLDSGESQWREPGQQIAATRVETTSGQLTLAPTSVVVYKEE
jgi:hypothetical protein